MVPASPAEAEALGHDQFAVTFGGTQFWVPLDVDRWPLHLIRTCRWWNPIEKHFTVNHSAVLSVLQELLGNQLPDLIAAAPKRRDLVSATNAIAAAVGIGNSSKKSVFGDLLNILQLLDSWPEKVESDLNRFWNLDYRDRWRLNADGRRLLTLRQVYVRMQNLPTDSAVAIALNGGKLHRTGTEIVLMDVWEALTHQRHPARPMPAEEAKKRDESAEADEKAKAAHRERMEKRKARQAGPGLERARQNALISQGRGPLHAQDHSQQDHSQLDG